MTTNDRAPAPIYLSDLSDVEREALLLLRKDEPRMLAFFVTSANSLGLMFNPDAVQAKLRRRGLAKFYVDKPFFVVLTADGARLQDELRRSDTL